MMGITAIFASSISLKPIPRVGNWKPQGHLWLFAHFQ